MGRSLGRFLGVALGAALSAAMAFHAAAFDLDGDWNLVSMCVPSELSVATNGMGFVADIGNVTDFALFTGNITITGGIFSGTFDGPTSGTISVDAGGMVTAIDDEMESTVLYLNCSNDFMANQRTEGQFQEILLAVKKPAATVPADVIGAWNLVSLCTPDAMQVTKDMGLVTGLINGSHFEVAKGTFTFNGDGTFTGTIGAEVFSGSGMITGPGVLHAVPGSGDPAFDLYLNAGKNIMAGVTSDTGFNEIIILIKPPATIGQIHELQERWNLVTFDVPSAVSVIFNMGNPIGVSGAQDFESGFGRLFFEASGFFKGDFGPAEVFSGTAAIAAPGRINFSPAGDPSVTACLNAAEDVFVGAIPDGDFNELLLGVRGIKAIGLASSLSYGTNELVIQWVGTETRKLQKLTAAAPTWMDVMGTLGESSATLPTTDGAAIFQVVEP